MTEPNEREPDDAMPWRVRIVVACLISWSTPRPSTPRTPTARSPGCQANWAQVDSVSTAPTRIWTELQNGEQTAKFEFTNYTGWAWSGHL